MTFPENMYRIAYYIRTDIQHLVPVLAVYNKLGGVVFTKKQAIFDYAKTNHPRMQIILIKSSREVRKYCRAHRIRIVIYTGNQNIWHGYSVQLFHGISDKKYEENIRIGLYDLLMINGQKQLDKINSIKPLKNKKRYKMVGYPKFDRLINNHIFHTQLFNNDNDIVLYAPTWISTGSGIKMGFSEHGESSLPLWGKKIIRAFQSLKEVNLVIKYHSRVNVNANGIYKEMNELIEELNLSERVKVVWDADIVPYMQMAKVMISDVSAVCYEWMHLDRPIIFANPAPEHYKPSEDLNDTTSAWKAGYVINREEDIVPFIQKSLHSDEKQEERKKILEYAFYKPDGKATDRQVQAIKKFYDEVNAYSSFRVFLHNLRKLIDLRY